MKTHRTLPVALLLACLPLLALGQSRKARPAAPAATPAVPTDEVAPVFASPAGVYAVVSNVALSAAHPSPEGLTGMRLLRAPAGSNSFREVAAVRPAATQVEFRQQTLSALDQIRSTHQLASDEAAWAWVQAHPSLDDYGLLGISMEFRVAMGTAALDASAASAPAGTRFTYRLVPEYAAGAAQNQAGPPLEATVVMGQRSPLPRPRLLRATGLDSMVSLRWLAPANAGVATPLVALFGRVWRRGPGERSFSVVAERVLTNRNERGDSVQFSFRQKVQPEAMYRYFVEPLDFVGNPGPPSDTATVLSVDVHRMPLVSAVAARDTTAGIALSWPALPPKGYLLGIEIQRSRDTRGNYVRLDTVATEATSYLDTRLLPDIVYHYRLRVLLRGNLPAPEATSGAAFAAHRSGEGRTEPPLPPVQLVAAPEGTGVRLRWQPAAPDLSLGGYFVYRGTSLSDSLVVVSPYLPPGQPTFLDTTARNGRRQYVYAVRAVNKALQTSEFSETAAARPNRPLAVSAPLGLSGFADGPVLRLRWDDVLRRDADVVAYRLYRRPAPATGTAPAAGAAAPASRAGYVVLADHLPAPAYEDRARRAGSSYQYAVAALDALGTESALSPPLTLGLDAAATRPVAPSQLNARPVAGGVEVSWSRPATAPGRGYALYRRTREQPAPLRLATLPATAQRYVDATARPQVLYIYSLAAVAATQESPRTTEVSVRR